MMPDQRKPFPSFEGGPGHHISHGAIVSNEIHIQGRKLLHVMPQVPDEGQGLQENLGEDNGRTQVDEHAPFELRDQGRKETEVAVRGFPE